MKIFPVKLNLNKTFHFSYSFFAFRCLVFARAPALGLLLLLAQALFFHKPSHMILLLGKANWGDETDGRKGFLRGAKQLLVAEGVDCTR